MWLMLEKWPAGFGPGLFFGGVTGSVLIAVTEKLLAALNLWIGRAQAL
jgi:hypothetical protein